MITVENYKAFHGVMKITPKTKCVPPLEIEGDWLYKPEYKCWYGNGASYGEDICTVVRDDTEKLYRRKPDDKERHPCLPDRAICSVCGTAITARWDYCQACGQKIDWEG